MPDRPTQFQQGVASVSDPTPLTTQALLREIAALKELAFTRLDATAESIKVAHDDLVRVPTAVDKAVGALKDLLFERFEVDKQRFENIHMRFQERDIRMGQAAEDNRTAIRAALDAQEKSANKQTESLTTSITKLESSIAKQIDQQSTLINTTKDSLNDKIDDVRQRLTRIEGEGRGRTVAAETQQSQSASSVNIIGLVVGSLIGATGIVVAIVSYMAK